MNSSQKPTVPVPTQKATGPLPPAEHSAPPSPSSCHTQPPHHGNSDMTCCLVHRLEEALCLTESFHLSNEQKAKITALTKKQTEESQALCAKAHEAHKATHAQIIALLTPDQQQKLRAMEPAADHCTTGGPGAAGKECHPTAH